MTTLSPELFWLTLTALATALMWVPHILWLIADRGLGPALMDGEHDITYTARWAARGRRAHWNAVENLAVFTAVILAVHLSGGANGLTATLAAVYFWARIAHYVVYVMGLPVVRTLLFAVGFVCQLLLGLSALGVV